MKIAYLIQLQEVSEDLVPYLKNDPPRDVYQIILTPYASHALAYSAIEKIIEANGIKVDLPSWVKVVAELRAQGWSVVISPLKHFFGIAMTREAALKMYDAIVISQQPTSLQL